MGVSLPDESYPHVSPSVLAADFSRLPEEIRQTDAIGVPSYHLDVMDGHFVPNLTFGPLIVKAIRKLTAVRLETHLMVVEPKPLFEAFVAAGSDQIAVHVEPDAVADVPASLQAIVALGADAAVAVNPRTPIEESFPHLDMVAQVLVMSVSPGFGGQAFMPGALAKIESLAGERQRRGLSFRIGVDGGVNPDTAPACLAAGADLLVAGTAFFRAPDRAHAIAAMLRRA